MRSKIANLKYNSSLICHFGPQLKCHTKWYRIWLPDNIDKKATQMFGEILSETNFDQ